MRKDMTARAKPSKPRLLAMLDYSMLIVKLPDGTLMGCGESNVGGVLQATARYSNDDGATWSDPETLFKLPEKSGIFGLCEALLDRDGEVHVFFINNPANADPTAGEREGVLVGELVGRRLDIWHARSSHGRTQWRPATMIWKGYTGALNSVIQMSNGRSRRTGRILLPFSCLTSRAWRKPREGLDAFTFTGQFDSTAVYSDDGGDTWRLASSVRTPVPDIVSAYGAVEPVVLQLNDGRVWMLIRTQMGRFYESFSDDGALWSTPRPTAIRSSDSPAGLVRLPDGRIVLLWNNCLRFPYAYGGRHLLHAAVSDDEGKTWRGCREVARDPRRLEPPPPGGDFGTAYPFPTLANEGKVIFRTGQGAGRVQLMLLDPDWLLETSRRADFSAGQDEWATFGTRGVEFSAHPTKPDANVLSIRKTDPDWPAAAVWNFPSGLDGRLRMRMMLKPGFAGALVAITDHFSVPFDSEDALNSLFNLEIERGGRLLGRAKLDPMRWHDLLLEWQYAKRQCRVQLDGREVGALPLRRETTGACYLRLRSTAEHTDATLRSTSPAGFLVESVEVDVSPKG